MVATSVATVAGRTTRAGYLKIVGGFRTDQRLIIRYAGGPTRRDGVSANRRRGRFCLRSHGDVALIAMGSVQTLVDPATWEKVTFGAIREFWCEPAMWCKAFWPHQRWPHLGLCGAKPFGRVDRG